MNQRLNTPFLGTREVGNPDDRLNRQHALVLAGEVGLSERLSIQGLIPVRTVDLTGREDLSTEGAGDLEVTLRTSLTHPERSRRFAAVAYYGAAFPTGKDPDPDVLQQNAQLSRGVVSGIVGGELSVKVGKDSQVYGRGETQLPLGDDEGYRFAAARTVAALFSSPFGGSKVRWLGGLEFRYAGRDRINAEDDGQGAQVTPNRGGHQTRLLGGILVGLTRRNNLGILTSYLLDADLAGDQLAARTELVVGWQGTFGTHRHPVD